MTELKNICYFKWQIFLHFQLWHHFRQRQKTKSKAQPFNIPANSFIIDNLGILYATYQLCLYKQLFIIEFFFNVNVVTESFFYAEIPTLVITIIPTSQIKNCYPLNKIVGDIKKIIVSHCQVQINKVPVQLFSSVSIYALGALDQ